MQNQCASVCHRYPTPASRDIGHCKCDHHETEPDFDAATWVVDGAMAMALRPGRVGLPGVVELLLLLSDVGVVLPESGAKRCNASINAPAEPAWVVGFKDVRDMPTLFNRGATHAGCEQIRDRGRSVETSVSRRS
jgi:hypothetical protein